MKELGQMTDPEIVEYLHRALDEIEIRMMQRAGEVRTDDQGIGSDRGLPEEPEG